MRQLLLLDSDHGAVVLLSTVDRKFDPLTSTMHHYFHPDAVGAFVWNENQALEFIKKYTRGDEQQESLEQLKEALAEGRYKFVRHKSKRPIRYLDREEATVLVSSFSDILIMANVGYLEMRSGSTERPQPRNTKKEN